MRTRPATAEELREYAKRKVREIVANKERLSGMLREESISKDAYMLEVSKYTGQLYGIRIMLDYSERGELV